MLVSVPMTLLTSSRWHGSDDPRPKQCPGSPSQATPSRVVPQPADLDYNIMERLDRRLAKFIYNSLHSNNSTVQSTVNSKLLLYPYSELSENDKYLMSKYKIKSP